MTEKLLEDVRRLTELRELHIDRTGISKQRLQELERLMPNTHLLQGNSNGPEFFLLAHHNALLWTRRVEDFELARRGDQHAAKRLLSSRSPDRFSAGPSFCSALAPYRSTDFEKHLLWSLHSGNSDTRQNALLLLSSWKRKLPIEELLQDASPAIRFSALEELKAPDTLTRLELVQSLVQDPNGEISNSACDALIRCMLPEAEAAVMQVFRQSSDEIKQQILKGLRGELALLHHAVLELAVSDTSPQIRILGYSRLLETDKRRFASLLAQGTVDKSPLVRRKITELLAQSWGVSNESSDSTKASIP